VIHKTITMEELNNDHYIVPHEQSWIILKCDICDVQFNSNPIHGKAYPIMLDGVANGINVQAPQSISRVRDTISRGLTIRPFLSVLS
jgi:hypothetical protein